MREGGPENYQFHPLRILNQPNIVYMAYLFLYSRFPAEVHLYILLLAHMHSTLNPIVYGLTNTHFKKGYR